MIRNNRKLTTIVLAKVLVSEFNGQEGTAIIPSSYKEYEIDTFSEIVEPGTILMAFSDGVYDHLPCTANTVTYPNGAICRLTSLNNHHFTSFFAKAASNSVLKDCVNILTQQVIENVEKIRGEKIKQAAAALAEKPHVESKFLLEEKSIRQEQEQVNNDFNRFNGDAMMNEQDKERIKQQLQSQQVSLKQRLLKARAPIEKLLSGVGYSNRR